MEAVEENQGERTLKPGKKKKKMNSRHHDDVAGRVESHYQRIPTFFSGLTGRGGRLLYFGDEKGKRKPRARKSEEGGGED